jgi:hypothetical protein
MNNCSRITRRAGLQAYTTDFSSAAQDTMRIRRAPAALVMLSFMIEPPMSLQPAANRAAARSGPIFTHDACAAQKLQVACHTAHLCAPLGALQRRDKCHKAGEGHLAQH